MSIQHLEQCKVSTSICYSRLFKIRPDYMYSFCGSRLIGIKTMLKKIPHTDRQKVAAVA